MLFIYGRRRVYRDSRWSEEQTLVKTDDLYLVYSIAIKLFYLITWPPELKATFFNLPTIKYMVFNS